MIKDMASLNPPKVSVIMAVKDGEKYLRAAMDSILAQVFTDFEFIVVDDRSTDSSLQIVQQYAQEDARIHVIENDHHAGLSASLNKGICTAQGELIARMDADDISLPHRLEEQAKYMNEHPEIDVLGTGFNLVDEAGNHLRSITFSNDPDILRWDLLFFTPIAHPSAMMRSSIIRKVGGYNTKIASAQDYELWTRVILAGRLSNLEEIHMRLRLHEARVTYKHRDQQIAFTSEAKQKYLQVVLNRNISAEAASAIKKKPITARRAAMAAALILDYCNYCIKGTSTPVAAQIMVSALEKTARKVGRFIIYPATWGIGVRFCLLLLRLMVTWLTTAEVRLAGALKRLLSIRKPDIGKGL